MTDPIVLFLLLIGKTQTMRQCDYLYHYMMDTEPC